MNFRGIPHMHWADIVCCFLLNILFSLILQCGFVSFSTDNKVGFSIRRFFTAIIFVPLLTIISMLLLNHQGMFIYSEMNDGSFAISSLLGMAKMALINFVIITAIYKGKFDNLIKIVEKGR